MKKICIGIVSMILMTTIFSAITISATTLENTKNMTSEKGVTLTFHWFKDNNKNGVQDPSESDADNFWVFVSCLFVMYKPPKTTDFQGNVKYIFFGDEIPRDVIISAADVLTGFPRWFGHKDISRLQLKEDTTIPLPITKLFDPDDGIINGKIIGHPLKEMNAAVTCKGIDFLSRSSF